MNCNKTNKYVFREFCFWYLPQIQYKNPYVQLMTLKNMTPSPFIRCFYGKYTLKYFIFSLFGKKKNWFSSHS